MLYREHQFISGLSILDALLMFETGAVINLLKIWVYWVKELIWKLCMIDSTEAVIVFITPFSCRILNSLPYLEITFPELHSDTRSSPTYEDRATE